MDPSQIQSDQTNDVHSLEHDDQSSNANVTDATGGASLKPAPESPFKKPSFFRKLWNSLNIYMLLFVLAVVLASGSLLAMNLKNQEQSKSQVKTQNLSTEALQQLAQTDVSVGESSQLLTVQANAVFDGTVLMRGDLEVAGMIKLGGDLSLSNLVVSGSSKLSDVTVNNLTVSSALNVQGALNLKSGLSVAAQSNFNGGLVASSIATGALQINGDLKLTNHISAAGPSPKLTNGSALGSGGTASISGSDISGSVAINTGGSPPAGCFATITFDKEYNSTPQVIISPVNAAAGQVDYYATRSQSNFQLCAATPPPASQSFGFDYVVIE